MDAATAGQDGVRYMAALAHPLVRRPGHRCYSSRAYNEELSWFLTILIQDSA
jgi:hypothetical protein